MQSPVHLISIPIDLKAQNHFVSSHFNFHFKFAFNWPEKFSTEDRSHACKSCILQSSGIKIVAWGGFYLPGRDLKPLKAQKWGRRIVGVVLLFSCLIFCNFFTEKLIIIWWHDTSFYNNVQKASKLLAAWLGPRPHWGAYSAPRPLAGMEGLTAPPIKPHPRSQPFELRPFGPHITSEGS